MAKSVLFLVTLCILLAVFVAADEKPRILFQKGNSTLTVVEHDIDEQVKRAGYIHIFSEYIWYGQTYQYSCRGCIPSMDCPDCAVHWDDVDRPNQFCYLSHIRAIDNDALCSIKRVVANGTSVWRLSYTSNNDMTECGYICVMIFF